MSEVKIDRILDNCVIVLTSFYMGIGRMRQVRNLEVTTDADKTKLRHQKILIESTDLDAIRSADGRLKRYVESKSCKFRDNEAFLNRALLSEVDNVIERYCNVERPELVAAFLSRYRDIYYTDFAELRETLGEQFDRADYPDPATVEAGFAFHYSYQPVGSVEGLQSLGIDSRIVEREAQKAKLMIMKAAEETRAALRLAGAGMVDTLISALKPTVDGKRKRLHETTVNNLHDFLGTFQFRDITNDDELQSHVEKLKQIMAGADVEKLRHSETLKDRVAAKLEVVRQDLGSLVTVSGRKFR